MITDNCPACGGDRGYDGHRCEHCDGTGIVTVTRDDLLDEVEMLRALAEQADDEADVLVGSWAMTARMRAVRARAEADRLEALIPVMWPEARREEAAE